MTDNRHRVETFIETLDDHDWGEWVSLLDPDAVYEIPQIRERIRGRDRYLKFFTFADGLITSVTDFWPEPYPPTGREHLVERW